MKCSMYSLQKFSWESDSFHGTPPPHLRHQRVGNTLVTISVNEKTNKQTNKTHLIKGI